MTQAATSTASGDAMTPFAMDQAIQGALESISALRLAAYKAGDTVAEERQRLRMVAMVDLQDALTKQQAPTDAPDSGAATAEALLKECYPFIANEHLRARIEKLTGIGPDEAYC